MSGFLGSHILEAAIGLSLIYLILAVFCTAANEWLAALLQARAATLRTSLHALLAHQSDGEQLFIDAFYSHPLIAGLMKGGRHPSYLPSRAFSNAVLDLVTSPSRGPITFADLNAGIANLPAGNVRTALFALIQNTEGDLHRAQASIEGWFDDAMDRASGWYKRRTQWFTLLFAALVTISLNADTLTVIHRIWLAQSGALLGWETIPHGLGAWTSRLTGWVLTTGAVSLGAPFWFDILNRLVHARGQVPTEPVALRDRGTGPSR